MTKQETYISFILDQLNAGEVSFEKVFELNRTKLNLGRTQFSKYWKIANERHVITLKEAQKASESIIISETKKNALNAIKTKNERLAILQKQVDETLNEIETGTTEDTINVGGSLKKVIRKHTVNETTLLRRTLHLLQAEISKIEGDYAPENKNVNLTGSIPITKWSD